MADEKYIQSLVFLVCDKGSLVVPFIATPKKEQHHGMTGGTTRDNIPLLNIMPFAVCTIDRIPCIPLMPEWKRYPENPVVIEDFYPLLLSSYCKCQKGGNIKVFETYKEAAEHLASVDETRVDGYAWLDETISGILAPGQVLTNRIFGKEANSQAIGRGFRQGLLSTWEGLKSLKEGDTWVGLGNMFAVAVIGYSNPIIPGMPIVPGVPEARLAAFDAIFKTHYADTDMAMKMALIETVDQKLLNGTEVEHGEFIGAVYAAVLEAAVGTKGGALVVKGVTRGGKMALGLQRYAALANRMNQFRSKLKWSKFKDIYGLFRKKKNIIIRSGKYGPDVRQAKIIRAIEKGESIADIVEEAKYLTRTEGIEHAVIKTSDGKRLLVSGGEHGIELPSNTQLIYGHTHPNLPGTKPFNNGPSQGDLDAIRQLDQSKQYIYHDGQRSALYKSGDVVSTTNY